MELDDCAFPLLADDRVHRRRRRRVRRRRRRPARRRDAAQGRAWSAPTCCRANGGIFKPQGEALSRSAKRDVKVLVVGNPANTNALIAQAQRHGPRPRSVHGDDAARPQPGRSASSPQKLGAPVTDVKKMTIWGNHSTTQYPDLFHAEVGGQERLRGRRRPRVGRRRRSSRRSPSAARRSSRRAAPRRRRRRPTPPSTTSARGRSARPTATGCRWASPATAATACRRGSSPASRHLRRRRRTRSSRASTSTTTAAAKIDASAAELVEERDAVRELGLI